MLSPLSLWKILRDLGPIWILKRAAVEAQLRLGVPRWRTPAEEWDFGSFDWLRRDIDRDAEAIKRSLLRDSTFFFQPEHLPTPALGDRVCERADRLLRGEWPYFFHDWRHVGFPPDWHLNPLNGSRVVDDVHWSSINLLGVRDVKFVWEASRFSVVHLLVRAYAVNGDDRYAQAFWLLVEDWAEKNPPNRGVNWASGQEAAFRVMAWCFGLFGFLNSPFSTATRVIRLLRMIQKHGERIRSFIAYGLSQQNNHGISEAVGLFTIGVLFPQLRPSAEWRKLGYQLIIRQVDEQIYEDGSYIQHSFNYQRVCIDTLVWAFRLGQLNSYPFPETSYAALDRAVSFMLQFCDSKTGRTPNYGANDGTLVLPLSSCDCSDFRPSLQAGIHMVRRNQPFGSGPWNEQLHWLFRKSEVELKDDVEIRGAAIRGDEPSGGYLKLTGREGYAMLRAARYRHRPSQADQLHLDLWWRGANIACDAGTYFYNGAPPWTNALAATRVHNTVSLCGRDQMTRVGPFLWVDWAQAVSERYELDLGLSATEASHDGYRRLGAKHKRSVLNLPAWDCWVVVDDVVGDFHADTRLHWLFGNCEYVWKEDQRLLRLQTRAGPFHCHLYAPPRSQLSLARAGKLLSGSEYACGDCETRGWRSVYYGTKEPALSLAVTTEAGAQIRYVSVLAPAEVVVTESNSSRVVVTAEGKEWQVSLAPLGSHPTFTRPGSQYRPR
jgi:asparagine synthase (glutamine-hydrolysing)